MNQPPSFTSLIAFSPCSAAMSGSTFPNNPSTPTIMFSLNSLLRSISGAFEYCSLTQYRKASLAIISGIRAVAFVSRVLIHFRKPAITASTASCFASGRLTTKREETGSQSIHCSQPPGFSRATRLRTAQSHCSPMRLTCNSLTATTSNCATNSGGKPFGSAASWT